MISHGPEDVTVNEGDSASFPCFLNETNGVPFWQIGDFVCTIRDLPRRHYYSNWTLTITDVQLKDNGTTYQCLIYIISSKIAVLTVSGGEIAIEF